MEIEMEKHEIKRCNLYGSESQAMAFVYDHRNIFADRTIRRPYYQGENVIVIEEYSRYSDGKNVRKQWWWWVFYPIRYEIYRWTATPTREEKRKLLNSIVEKAKKEDD